MYDFLNGFEKRIEFINIVESIINRKNKNTELENLFNEYEMTGVIISTLLFIMDKTLDNEDECTIKEISLFLEVILKKYYNIKLDKEKVNKLANYIVKTILQNNGEIKTYKIKNYLENTDSDFSVRLISDKLVEIGGAKRLTYYLTNQGYDFLFRTKEVDEEIQLTIEQLKLREYIKRKKFSHAVQQSIDLLKMVRQKKQDVENFIRSVKENVVNVEYLTYEKIINGIYDLLQEENEIIDDIIKMTEKAEEGIKEEFELKGEMDIKLYQAENEIQIIINNLRKIRNERSELILNKSDMADLYVEVLKNSLEYNVENRYDIEETILNRLEGNIVNINELLNILLPFLKPKLPNYLNLLHVYQHQSLYKPDALEENNIISIEENNDNEYEEKVKEINEKYVEIVKIIVQSIIKEEKITASKIISTLKENEYELYLKLSYDKLIYKVMMLMYDYGEINIDKFLEESGHRIINKTEEFNIDYCLNILLEEKILNPNELNIIRINQTGKEFVDKIIKEKIDNLEIAENITMTDLEFKM